MKPSPPDLMNRVLDLTLAALVVGLMLGIAHGAAALADLVDAPGKVVCLNPAGVDDVK